MSNKKISKLGLLSYLDGELNEKDNIKIKDYLLESEDDTDFLEKIVIVEKTLENEDCNLLLQKKNKEKIFSNANHLLKCRKEKIQKREEKNKRKEYLINEFKNTIFDFRIKISYEYVVLCTLLIIFIFMIQPETYEGNMVAFEMKTYVVARESNE